jgi:hypothetical protein
MYVYNCAECRTRCDGKSKGKYLFENDVEYSEKHEQNIIQLLKNKGFVAYKCQKDGYPDIVVKDKKGKLISYIEVKAQRRTFMSVERLLPNADLKPSETVALNLSDLLRYFGIFKRENCSISILWVLENRPCILKNNESMYFYQTIEKLTKIYDKYKDKRKFRRKSGIGDIVDGVHKGVVVNYHFSLNELILWKI